MIKIAWDIDGVLRDLCVEITKNFGFEINSWNWNFEGKNVYDLAREKPEMLVNAPATKYIKIVNSLVKDDIEIWSHQPPEWRPYTNEWLKKYLNPGLKINLRYLNPQQKYETLMKEPETILVDDYPLFTEYDRIILIDAIYNQSSDASIRVKTEEELIDALFLYK